MDIMISIRIKLDWPYDKPLNPWNGKKYIYLSDVRKKMYLLLIFVVVH